MGKSTSRQSRFSVYIPPDVLNALRKEAFKNRRSMNNQIVLFVMQGLGMPLSDEIVVDKQGGVRAILDISPDVMKKE